MRKLFVFLLAAVFSVFTVFAAAGEEEPEKHWSGDFIYIVQADGTAKIEIYNGQKEKCEIPVQLDGHRVASIGDCAFAYHDSLASVTIPDSVLELGYGVFVGCQSLKEIIVSPDHPTMAAVDGALCSKADKRLITFPMASGKTEYTIPQGTKEIGEYAFYDCKNLTAITIPDSVTKIGMDSFFGCGDLMCRVGRDSYAMQYCIDHGMNYTMMEEGLPE